MQRNLVVSSVPARDAGAGGVAQGMALQVDPVGLRVPDACACCGAVAATSIVETRANDDASIIVPYCTDCQRHASAVSTRNLASSLASVIAAGTLAAVLPMLWERAHPVAITLVVLLAALPPIAVIAWWRARPGSGHSSSGRAVWWLSTGELACSHVGWGSALAENNRLAARCISLPHRNLSAWMVSGAVVALVGTPFSCWLHRPLVRVVNLTETTVTVMVDGDTVARLTPTSAESATAGLELRLPAGPRHLQAVADDGRRVADAQVVIRAGRQHLYAPGSLAYCFWLETVGYGEQTRSGVTIERLEGKQRFWVLPEIDAWFAPNPLASVRDTGSTGGVRTALRQARCTQAPPSVRHGPSTWPGGQP